MTDTQLTRERNLFLGGFALLIVMGIALRTMVMQASESATDDAPGSVFAGATVVVAKIALAYLVFRLSRFLQQPVWLTLLYCLSAPFPILYLVPVIGLLVAVRTARKAIVPVSPSPSQTG